VQVNAAIPNGLFQEWPAPGEGSELNTSLVEPAITIDAEGFIKVPTGPGLGISLNQDVFKKYRIA